MWGLDDYQCLPFLWGSSQLAEHPSFTPPSIHKEAVLREAAPDYLYMAAIAFIRRVRRVTEHLVTCADSMGLHNGGMSRVTVRAVSPSASRDELALR